MTIIDSDATHERCPDWLHFRCDICQESFWGPARSTKREGPDECDQCARPGWLHFVGNGLPGVITPHDGDWDSLADWGSYYDVARRLYEDSPHD